jgi:hypothetical protein
MTRSAVADAIELTEVASAVRVEASPAASSWGTVWRDLVPAVDLSMPRRDRIMRVREKSVRRRARVFPRARNTDDLRGQEIGAPPTAC